MGKTQDQGHYCAPFNVTSKPRTREDYTKRIQSAPKTNLLNTFKLCSLILPIKKHHVGVHFDNSVQLYIDRRGQGRGQRYWR